MRFHLLLLFICLLNICSIRADDFPDDIDEEVTIEDSSKQTASSAQVEKTAVPTLAVSSSNIYFEDQFQDKTKWSRWIKSQTKKDGVEDSISKYDGEWSFEIPQSAVYTDDYGLVLKSRARHHAIAANLFKPFDFSTSPLIVQYEVKYQTNQECGGAYVKLLSHDGKNFDLKQLTDKTPYTIMFGPDMCGVEHKYHFIIRYRNPKTGVYSEHQAKKPTEPLDSYFTDKKSHLYTLVVSADNSFKMYIDNKLINSGNLLEDLEPSIIPPKEIVDETDRKPDDWDDREKIPDVTATKPDDWDETQPKEIPDTSAQMPSGWLESEFPMIPDPEAVQPADWDTEIDGSWEAPQIDNPVCKDAPGCGPWSAPMIPNPAYKGIWRAPLIDNPNYRGKWEPRKIPNPDYFEESHPYKLTPIGSIALELWSIVDGVVFDNFLVTSDQSIAKQYADEIWYSKSVLETKAISAASESVIDAIVNATKDRPWLWAVYLIAIVLPIVILIVFCTSRKSPAKSADASRKKTDQPVPDTVDDRSSNRAEDDEEEEEEDDGEIEEIDTTKSTRNPSTSKDDLQDEKKDMSDNDATNTKSGETSNANQSPSSGNKARRRARKDN